MSTERMSDGNAAYLKTAAAIAKAHGHGRMMVDVEDVFALLAARAEETRLARDLEAAREALRSERALVIRHLADLVRADSREIRGVHYLRRETVMEAVSAIRRGQTLTPVPAAKLRHDMDETLTCAVGCPACATEDAPAASEAKEAAPSPGAEAKPETRRVTFIVSGDDIPLEVVPTEPLRRPLEVALARAGYEVDERWELFSDHGHYVDDSKTLTDADALAGTTVYRFAMSRRIGHGG